MAKSPKPKSLKATVTHLEIKRFPHTFEAAAGQSPREPDQGHQYPAAFLPLPAMAGGPRMALGQSPAHER